MRKILSSVALVPLLALTTAPAGANIGTCYIEWFDAVTACANSEPCASAADAQLMACLQREARVEQ